MYNREIRRKEPAFSPMVKLAGGLVAAVVVVIILVSAVAIVPAGNRGVLTTFGDVEEDFVLGEGLHFKLPVAQNVVNMAVRTQKYETAAPAASRDLQDTKTTVVLNFHIVPDLANDIYQNMSLSYDDIVILPAIQEVVKASTAKYSAEELITKRPLVKQDIETGLIERLNDRGIIVETLSITDFQFSEVFDDAIEAKQKAEQEVLTEKNILEKIKVQKEQKIVQAEATAQSIRVETDAEVYRVEQINDAIANNPNYIQWRATERWDGVLPIATGGALPFINIPTGSSISQ